MSAKIWCTLLQFEAIQQKIRTYQANEEARVSQALKAAGA